MHAAASGRFQESEKSLASGRSWPQTRLSRLAKYPYILLVLVSG
jgi:hypothetical protein